MAKYWAGGLCREEIINTEILSYFEYAGENFRLALHYFPNGERYAELQIKVHYYAPCCAKAVKGSLNHKKIAMLKQGLINAYYGD